jgi:hypothetical protein
MTLIVLHLGVLDHEPQIAVILAVFALLAIFGLFAGNRWGWRASLVAIPVLAATSIFCMQYSNLEYKSIGTNRTFSWDEFGNFIYALLGGFSISLITTVTGIWIHQRNNQRANG